MVQSSPASEQHDSDDDDDDTQSQWSRGGRLWAKTTCDALWKVAAAADNEEDGPNVTSRGSSPALKSSQRNPATGKRSTMKKHADAVRSQSRDKGKGPKKEPPNRSPSLGARASASPPRTSAGSSASAARSASAGPSKVSHESRPLKYLT